MGRAIWISEGLLYLDMVFSNISLIQMPLGPNLKEKLVDCSKTYTTRAVARV